MAYVQELPATFSVNNVAIPAVGYGTFQSNDGNEHVKDAVLAALRSGYRHIDTATSYENERHVGQAIQESGIAREEIFVTTKLYVSIKQPVSLKLRNVFIDAQRSNLA